MLSTDIANPLNWHDVSESRSIDAEQFDREERLRQRVRQLNAQVDDLSRTLRIPHNDLMDCVNRLLATAQNRFRARTSSDARA
jgi:hypothetical protein